MMEQHERSEAIGRAQLARKALGEHPRSSRREFGHARDYLDACYSAGDRDWVWDSVAKLESRATRRYVAPSGERCERTETPTSSPGV